LRARKKHSRADVWADVRKHEVAADLQFSRVQVQGIQASQSRKEAVTTPNQLILNSDCNPDHEGTCPSSLMTVTGI
jgi:hypothetical protein